jgi:hypothetical protein
MLPKTYVNESHLTASKQFEIQFDVKICEENICGDRFCSLRGQKIRIKEPFFALSQDFDQYI